MGDDFAGDPRMNRERMLPGDLYSAEDPDNDCESRRAVALQARYAAHIKPPLFVDYGIPLTVGARSNRSRGAVGSRPRGRS